MKDSRLDDVPVHSVEELLGIETGGELARIENSPELLSSQVAQLAIENVDKRLVNIRVIDGATYRITKGEEHFKDKPGIFDEAYKDRPDIFGFRLAQKQVKGEVHPILLVSNGDVHTPIATVHMPSKMVAELSDYDATTDTTKLQQYAFLMAKIKTNSLQKLQEEETTHERESSRRKRRVRKWIIGLGIAGIVAAVGPNVYDRAQTALAEKQATDAREEAEANRRAAAERAERERSVRGFDASHEIFAASIIETNEPGLAKPTREFVDVVVPNLEATDIDGNLARDVNHPRAINLNFPENSTTQTVGFEIQEGESYVVVHDGDPNRLYNVLFNPKENKLIIRNNGTIDGNDKSQAASHIFIQKKTR